MVFIALVPQSKRSLAHLEFLTVRMFCRQGEFFYLKLISTNKFAEP